MQDFEKLGEFYLGKCVDPVTNKSTEEMLLYDSPDLTTHAVCIGMTGSGKTGLCISLLEEAALDGIPAIIIDPKGDMTNLVLTFPELSEAAFRPWINPDEARKKQRTEDEYAQDIAAFWKKGLEDWGQSGERIRRLKEAAGVRIYTPGSTSGIPLSIMKSFDVPPSDVMQDTDLLNERISSTVTGLLGLLGLNADPIQSRDHILLSNLFHHEWKQARSLNMASLIQGVQNPPFKKMGILDVESFYPSRERFSLAMTINNLLAAPAFQTWLQGTPLDIHQMLYDEAGKPQLAVVYIAHLSDTERMFFVTLLLNQMVGWMRQQAGTSSLRALLYFDEIFGYMPPTANPPSKKLLLTLLKQARAFGLGVVTATQNPVDLDYKGLSNIGTWFIGRLQTDRDRERVLDGMSGAEGFDRKTLEAILASLDKRIFLMHNVHEKEPVVFHTRWAMSYLAGPLTRNQIKIWSDSQKIRKEVFVSSEKTFEVSQSGLLNDMPVFPSEITPFFIPLRELISSDREIQYRPCLWGSAIVQFSGKEFPDFEKEIRMTATFADGPIPVDWNKASVIDIPDQDLSKTAEKKAAFQKVPAIALQKKSYASWERDFKDFLYRTQELILWKSSSYKILSKPEENEQAFRVRLSQVAREQRDAWTESLRQKYSVKTTVLERKIRTAEDRLAREQEQARQQKYQTAVNVGATLIGAFLGGKVTSRGNLGRAGMAMRSAGRVHKESLDVNIAEENLTLLKQELKDLQDRFQEEVDANAGRFDALQETLEPMTIHPTKTGISVRLLCFVWAPVQV